MSLTRDDEGGVASLLITGADGYVGRLLVTALANADPRFHRVIATDLRSNLVPAR